MLCVYLSSSDLLKEHSRKLYNTVEMEISEAEFAADVSD